MPDSDAMEVVYTVRDAMVAEIIKNVLAEEGIFCAIENEHQAGLTGVLDIVLKTPRADAERARRIIRENRSARQSEDWDENDDEGDD